MWKKAIERRWVFLRSVLWIPVIPMLLVTSWGLCRESPFANGHFWEKDGFFLHYRAWFPEHPRKKIFLIHGLGGSTFSWRYAPDFLLNEGYCIVAVDLPGFGYSQRVTGKLLKAEAQAQLLLDFLEFLDTTLVPEHLSYNPWCLAGHSMGGKIAFLMAMEEPERFPGVLLVDAAFRGPSLRFFKIFTTFPPLRGCWVTLIRHLLLTPSRVRRFLAEAYGRKPSTFEVEGYLAPLRLPGTARSLLSLVNQASSLRLAAFSGKPHPPFLLLWGERDRFVPRRQAEKFQEVFPETPLVVVPGASHCPMETHPEEFYRVAVEFCNALALPLR
ncbi:alpha/beta fold hydrolase [Candidatus Caldatribacterium sp. SIUC1]|uniref:alpha/beta fold hydrolase n=1 Tax=Candidatus Caldatribacterium sp. SIUC1 TaxID=3418365 RepID=UPI003F68D252